MYTFLEFGTDLERRNESLFQRHRFAGTRIARHSWLTTLHAEDAKPSKLNALSFGKGLDDAMQQTINHGLGLELRQTSLRSDLVYDIGFCDVQRSLTSNQQYVPLPPVPTPCRPNERTANIAKSMKIHKLSRCQDGVIFATFRYE